MATGILVCGHKCHEVGLNPWVPSCPICGCANPDFNPAAEPPDWLKNMLDNPFGGFDV